VNKRNSKISTQPPQGTRDYLPVDAEAIIKTAEILLNEYSKRGYKRVITPSVEFIDIFRANTDANELFKGVDIGSGELLSFRSDFTPQIGRLSSAIINSRSRPFKFSYCGPVLRNFDPIAGKSREIWQVGVELIGPDCPESDAELIVMGIESLKKLNIKDFNVDIGNVEFFHGIVSDINDNYRKKIEECVIRKDSSSLNYILQDVPLSKKKKDIIKELPFLFGEKDIIKKAWMMADNERSKKAIENMDRVLSYIKLYKLEKYVTIDLGEIRGLNYYTGIIFECFVPHIGYEIFGGGRYNNLLGMFGQDSAGAGFAVNLDTLAKCAGQYSYEGEDYLIANKTGSHSYSADVDIFLKKNGFKTEINFMEYSYLDFVEYMEQNNIKNFVYIYYDKESDSCNPCVSLKNINSEREIKFNAVSEFKKFIIKN
jgi:ATP phosphoribosyltransferase regulatory subunit